jgi:exo-beta-1,3-glucanase (GH17 family)
MDHHSDFEPYQDYQDTPRASGSGPNQAIAGYELQDYYDDTNIPPPHRLSGFNSLSHTPSPRNSSPDINSTQLNTPSDAHTRGLYSEPLAAATAASTPDEPFMAPSGPNFYEYGGSQDNRWLEKQQAAKKRSKWIVIGSIVALVGLIAVGVGVGVGVSKSHKSSSSSSSSNVVTQSNPNDPSSFEKNPALKQSFYGLAYTPEGVQLPNCGAKLSDVITDIQLLSQLTTRVRLYGADCNQSAMVLDAIQQTKVNMSVYLGNYAEPNDNNTAYDRQRGELDSVLQTFGTDHILGLTVGNEFMLNYLTDNSATDPNGPVGDQGAALLIADINDTKSNISALTKNVPIGTADAGAFFNNEVLENVAYGMSNVHPWFANVSIDQAAAWTANFFETTNVQPAAQLNSTPKFFIAETGWPTQSSDASNANNGASAASEANLQTFLDDFVCQANANGTGYFFFEYFDEPWKDVQFGGVEGWWGLFHSNRTLKRITIPDCPSS